MIHCKSKSLLQSSVFPSTADSADALSVTLAADGCKPLAQADVLFFIISYTIKHKSKQAVGDLHFLY